MKTILLALFLALAPLGAQDRPVARVDLFVATDCPIARASSPEIERLHLAYGGRGVAFRLVFPDRDLEETTVREHLAAFALTVPFVIDREGDLVRRAKATTTPEAVLFDPQGRIVYRGKIDNRYSALGKRLAEATEFPLRDAIEAILAGRAPAVPETVPVGCLIEG